MTMTHEEAREELMKRFPGRSVSADCNLWYFRDKDKKEGRYSIAYDFNSQGCSMRYSSSSFEECFSQLDEENAIINAEIRKYSILLRKFDIDVA